MAVERSQFVVALNALCDIIESPDTEEAFEVAWDACMGHFDALAARLDEVHVAHAEAIEEWARAEGELREYGRHGEGCHGGHIGLNVASNMDEWLYPCKCGWRNLCEARGWKEEAKR